MHVGHARCGAGVSGGLYWNYCSVGVTNFPHPRWTLEEGEYIILGDKLLIN